MRDGLENTRAPWKSLEGLLERLFLLGFRHQLGHRVEVVVDETFDTLDGGVTSVGYHQ